MDIRILTVASTQLPGIKSDGLFFKTKDKIFIITLQDSTQYLKDFPKLFPALLGSIQTVTIMIWTIQKM